MFSGGLSKTLNFAQFGGFLVSYKSSIFPYAIRKNEGEKWAVMDRFQAMSTICLELGKESKLHKREKL